MGNKKFKFSDMIPNAWFYKLKDMSKTTKQAAKKKLTPMTTSTTQKKPQLSQPQHTNKSHKFTTTTTKTTTEPPPRSSADKFPPPKHHSKPTDVIRFPEVPPRKSTCRRRSISRRKHVPVNFRSNSQLFLFSSESSSSETDFPDSINIPSELDSELDSKVNRRDHLFTSWPSSCNCRLSSSTADIIIDLNDEEKHAVVKTKTTDERFVDVVSEMIDLPPILTKPMNFDDTIFAARKQRSSRSRVRTSDQQSTNMSTTTEQKTTNNSVTNNSARRSSSGSPGIRLRTHSPRLASKKMQAYARKSVSSRNRHLSESFAVVKSSVDPQRDFRDSMVEMIVENNIRGSKDLEELLACYLSLNSKEYHDVIVKAFEQIWFDLDDVRV